MLTALGLVEVTVVFTGATVVVGTGCIVIGAVSESHKLTYFTPDALTTNCVIVIFTLFVIKDAPFLYGPNLILFTSRLTLLLSLAKATVILNSLNPNFVVVIFPSETITETGGWLICSLATNPVIFPHHSENVRADISETDAINIKEMQIKLNIIFLFVILKPGLRNLPRNYIVFCILFEQDLFRCCTVQEALRNIHRCLGLLQAR